MPANPIAENVLGTIGTILWTGQLIPQVLKSWRERSTTGLSPWLVLIWGLAALFLGVYAIMQDLNVPLIVQPQLFGFLAFLSWGQCMRYEKKLPLSIVILMTSTLMLVVGGLEAGLVLALRPFMNVRVIQFFGIFASVLLACGLLPQYWEIAKRREVMGISIVFLSIDIMGAVFSDLSLVFRHRFDVVAFAVYTLVIAMDSVIIVAAGILNPLARRRRYQAEAEANAPNGPRQMAFTSTMSTVEKLHDVFHAK